MRGFVVFCAAAWGLGAQTGELSPDALLLARIKTHMMDTLTRQPNYTCLETVERSRRDSATRKFHLEDVLRIEVALVDNKEMFAWPGSKQFEDRDFRELIPTGTFGTGDFALHSRSVFGSGAPIFEPRGEQRLNGLPVIRFDFRVPRNRSGYQVRTSGAEAIIGYHGSFYVEPHALDLIRLEVVGDDIPAVLKLKALSDSMDYARIRLGDGDFLLPQASEVILMDLNGDESRNRLRFTACHQYAGRSVLRFEEPDPVAASAANAARSELELPGNLDVIMSLAEDIDTEQLAIGDAVHARLYNDLKWKGRVLATKGASVSGRISRMERHPNFIVLGFIFTDLESPSVHAKLALQFERLAGFDTINPGRGWVANASPLEHEGLVPLPGGRARLMRGTLLFWRT